MNNKPKDPFEKYRKDKVNKRLEFIRGAITDLNAGQFATASQLAIYLSKLLTRYEQQQYDVKKSKDNKEWSRPKPKAVSKSTLLRNNLYRIEIDAYLLGKKTGVKEIAIPKSLNEAQLKVRSLELKVSNMKSENERLQNYIKHIESNSNNKCLQNNDKDDLGENLMECQQQRDKLSSALANLYWYLDDFLDVRDGAIYDVGYDKKIVEKELIEACVDLLLSKKKKSKDK